MSVVLVGGMKRLERHYQSEARRFGISLKICNSLENTTVARIKGADVVVLFTNKVSHQAKNEAVRTAAGLGIPVRMYHSCGLCTLRECFRCLEQKKRN